MVCFTLSLQTITVIHWTNSEWSLKQLIDFLGEIVHRKNSLLVWKNSDGRPEATVPPIEKKTVYLLRTKPLLVLNRINLIHTRILYKQLVPENSSCILLRISSLYFPLIVFKTLSPVPWNEVVYLFTCKELPSISM